MNNKNTYSTSFILRTAKAKNGKAPIYCRITVNGQRIEFSIKRSVAINQWDDGKVKGNNEEAKTLKAYLKQVEAKLFEHYRNLLANNTLMTAEDIKNAYLGLEKQQHSLLELIDYHNNHLKDTLEWGTLKNYFTLAYSFN